MQCAGCQLGDDGAHLFAHAFRHGIGAKQIARHCLCNRCSAELKRGAEGERGDHAITRRSLNRDADETADCGGESAGSRREGVSGDELTSSCNVRQ